MVGLAFIELFVMMLKHGRVRLDTADDKAAVTEFIRMCVGMVDTDASKRYTPKQALAHFKIVRGLVSNLVGLKAKSPKRPANAALTESVDALSHVTPPKTPPVSLEALRSPVHETRLAPCPPGKERNPDTKRCRKVGAKTKPKAKANANANDVGIKIRSCPENHELDLSTGRCLKVCPPGSVRNPKTKRCNQTVKSPVAANKK